MRPNDPGMMIMPLLMLGLAEFPDRPIKRRGWKAPGTSATGSITIAERQRRNKKRKESQRSKKRNR